mmetsp:Transcript_26831/g.40914  ORF Transcript_26831/g.40914 Transcript_26831/m.40914 type:complete len:160 (+) Transcript_26831:58-537(+)
MTKQLPQQYSTASRKTSSRKTLASAILSDKSSSSESIIGDSCGGQVGDKMTEPLGENHPNTQQMSTHQTTQGCSPSVDISKGEEKRPKRVRNAQKRKLARLESRQQRKHQNIIPIMSKMIAATANTLDQQLGKMIQLSGLLYPEFVRCSCSVDPSTGHR